MSLLIKTYWPQHTEIRDSVFLTEPMACLKGSVGCNLDPINSVVIWDNNTFYGGNISKREGILKADGYFRNF